METEQLANKMVTYNSPEDRGNTCVDNLKDGAHYKFSCRCGCGGEFAGYGIDIKSSRRVSGRSDGPDVHVGTTSHATSTDYVGIGTTSHATSGGPASTADAAEQSDAIEVVEVESDLPEAAEDSRPFVSDRYIKKAIFRLSDDEIDALNREVGFGLSDRDPPGIGDLAWSLSTKEGPFVVVEYVREKVKVGENAHDVWHAIVKTSKAEFTTLPLADLVRYRGDLPPEGLIVMSKFKLMVIYALFISVAASSGVGLAILLSQ